MLKKDLVIIPTYNEAINSNLIYKKIRSTNSHSEILFIDDNSPDNTSLVINEIMNFDKKVHLINRKQKLGIGSAHKEGFLWAKEKRFDYVTTIDADLSHNPDLIPYMLKNIESYNIIITGRFLQEDTLDEWPLMRQFITKTRHKVVKFLLNIPYDTSGAFRCYNFNYIKIDDLLMAKDNGYSFFWESLFILYKKEYSILEIPMKQPRRIHGSSKINIKDIFRAITYLIYFYFKKKF
jgi:dolichol-phosphate mannosyltransferase